MTDITSCLNRQFAQEMKRIVPAENRNRNRGSALSNSDRGLTLAERSRGRGIHVADMHEGAKVRRFSEALRYAGRGLIAVDVGFRGERVRQAYRDDENWKREIAAQVGGLGAASLGGLTSGQLVFGLSRVALAATPFGWGFIIGSSVAVGAITAFQLDKRSQSWINEVWDKLFGRQ